MEASNGAPPPPVTEEGDAPPPAPPAPEQQTAAASAPEKNPKRPYGVFTGLSLKVGTASDRKAAGEALAALAPESGDLMVLVRVGNATSTTPKAALIELGQIRPLDGDYEVIAESARNEYKDVHTAQRVEVSIG